MARNEWSMKLGRKLENHLLKVSLAEIIIILGLLILLI
jgi:hypothetical protein